MPDIIIAEQDLELPSHVYGSTEHDYRMNNGAVGTEPEAEGMPGSSSCARTDFDYGALDRKTAGSARRHAENVKSFMRISAMNMVRVGEELIKAKKLLGHGSFLRWIEAEFGWSKRSAQRLMGISRQLADKSDTVALLEPRVLQALASPSVPKAVRLAIMSRLEAGEPPNSEAILAEIKEARKEATSTVSPKRAASPVAAGFSGPARSDIPSVQEEMAIDPTADCFEAIGDNVRAVDLLVQNFPGDFEVLLALLEHAEPSVFLSELIHALRRFRASSRSGTWEMSASSSQTH